MLASLGVGRLPITLSRVLEILVGGVRGGSAASGPWSGAEWFVLLDVRLPRVILVVLCGMALALSGAVLQGVFRNPLIGPEIVGVTAGASFGGVGGILMALPMVGVIGTALVGGVAALLIAFGIARLSGTSAALSLVLAGVVTGAFFAALVGLAQYTADPDRQLPSIVYWLLGSFAAANWLKAALMSALLLVGGTVLIGLRWRINVLSLGDLEARSLGVNVTALRWFCVALVALLVAGQVSVSGGIAWIGLVVPHMARMMVGPDHRTLLPASALVGGALLLLMDDLARSLISSEIPIGLLTALVGTPLFAWILRQRRLGGWSGR
jgi:iron complex transport system permease protein